MILFAAAGVLALCASVSMWGAATDKERRALWLVPLVLIAVGAAGFVASLLVNAETLLPVVWPVLPELSAIIAFAAVPATAFVVVGAQGARALSAVLNTETRRITAAAS